MSNIDYNIIDRITALKIELEQSTLNEIRVLIGIRNILFDVDEMTMPSIREHLVMYYNLNPSLNITPEIINYITQNNSGINSINNLLNIWFNNINVQNNSQNINNNQNSYYESSDEELFIDSDLSQSVNEGSVSEYSETEDSEMEDSETEGSETEGSETEESENNENNNNFNENIYNSFFETLPNLSGLNSSNSIYSYNNSSNNGVSSINFTYSNPSLVNLSNIPNITDQMSQFTNSIFNIVGQTHPINNNQEDIPIVIKYSSLSKLKCKKYKDIKEKLKNANKKCMITLEEFKNDDIVRILPCNHIFTKSNIDDWLLNNSYKCPICRKPAGEYYAKIN